MFDKLLDFLISIWKELLPFIIINHYERGVRLRLGKVKSPDLEPGIHFKIPFADKILTSIITQDTLNIAPVSVTTIDNKTISVGGVVEFNISDIRAYIIDTNEARSNMHDISRCIMADYLTDCTWEECKDKKTTRTITRLLAKKCEVMGIEVTGFTLSDMSMSRVIKLISDKNIF